MVYRFGQQDCPGALRDREVTGGRGRDRDRRDNSRGVEQRGNDRPRQQHGPGNDRSHQQHGPPGPDRNAACIWQTFNVTPANVLGMLQNAVTCLPPRYAWSAT